MVSLVDPTPWIPVIGRFMMAFGNSEARVNGILGQWYPAEELNFFVSMPLEARVKLLKAAAASRRELFTDANIDTLLLNLSELQSLAKTRNLIAHNPLVLTVFEEDDQVVEVKERITHEHKGDEIDLTDLERKAGRAERVADALMQNQTALQLWGVTNLIGDFPTTPMNTPLKKA
jgi:hypothetical protein